MCRPLTQHSAVIVVDPVSTGLHVAREVLRQGYSLVILHSSPAKGDKVHGLAGIPEDVRKAALGEFHYNGMHLLWG